MYIFLLCSVRLQHEKNRIFQPPRCVLWGKCPHALLLLRANANPAFRDSSRDYSKKARRRLPPLLFLYASYAPGIVHVRLETGTFPHSKTWGTSTAASGVAPAHPKCVLVICVRLVVHNFSYFNGHIDSCSILY